MTLGNGTSPGGLMGQRIVFVHPGRCEAARLDRYRLGRAAGREIYEAQLAGQPAASALRRGLATAAVAKQTVRFELDRAPEIENGFQYTLRAFDPEPLSRRRRVVKCLFEEGVLAGILEAMAGRVFFVQEVQCRGGGAESCLMDARPL